MKLFVSAEEGPWPEEKKHEIHSQILSIHNNSLTPLEKFLVNKDYGSSLKTLYIIQMILRPDIKLYEERTLYKAKEGSADYRLKIDYDAFVQADEQEKRRLIIENILQCVRLLGEKTKKQKTDFDAQRLENDIIEFTKHT